MTSVMRKPSPRPCKRPTMKFVATKTAGQLDLQALHRVRERLVGQRTGIIDQIRAFLLERRAEHHRAFPAVRVAGYPRHARRCPLAPDVACHRRAA
jgi:transposase